MKIYFGEMIFLKGCYYIENRLYLGLDVNFYWNLNNKTVSDARYFKILFEILVNRPDASTESFLLKLMFMPRFSNNPMNQELRHTIFWRF